MPRRASTPASVYSVSSAESDDYAPSLSPPPTKKRRIVKKTTTAIKRTSVKASLTQATTGADIVDLEDAAGVVRPHSASYHSTEKVQGVQEALLSWFEAVSEKRGMPWRKPYDDSLSMEEKGQRAYEIWVSEIMLQQTQVATVIAYWQRWIERWPTIADLAKADVEEVNAAWRGLGYYRRARSLLAGAKTVMGSAKLPNDPVKLEKEIDGVGRYTAGAICSMAYGIRTPIVDGNIHRLLTRLLAIHAPQTSPAVIKTLWAAAAELVGTLPVDERDGIAGDWNQALMELGSQVCKPVAPDCGGCPLKVACKAYAELSAAPPVPAADAAGGSEAACTLCVPIPRTGPPTSGDAEERIPAVTVFPMRKEKKASREEAEVVCITEWRDPSSNGEKGDRYWLFIKRPEKGLLAGLFEPPTTPIQPTQASDPDSLQACARLTVSNTLQLPLADLQNSILSHQTYTSVPHIFSHINMTYHVQHLVLAAPISTRDEPAPETSRMDVQARPEPIGGAVWLTAEQVDGANIGTGVKKVWGEVFGLWGCFDVLGEGGTKVGNGVKGKGKDQGKGKGRAAVNGKDASKRKVQEEGGRVVKKIMMPLMPSKAES